MKRHGRRKLMLGSLAWLGAACGGREERAAPSGRTAPEEMPALDPERARLARLLDQRERLRPLHQRAGRPKPGEWRHEHPETGQTFEEYLRGPKTLPTVERRTIVIRTLGVFDPERAKVLELTVDYIGRFFGLPTRLEAGTPLSVVPPRKKRTHPRWGDRQILSQWILDELLAPNLPADATSLIAFTTSDLYPAEDWNFVFGQADLQRRVGVWSVYRHGDPSTGAGAFRLALSRALKVAVHELGHMFSVEHCTAYACVMEGINSLEESDRSPLWACPECVSKIVWATRQEHASRYASLAEFCERHGLRDEAALFRSSIAKLD